MEEEGTENLSEDEIFYVLSNQRRRYVLYYLKQHDGPVELTELVNQMAAWEEGIPVEDVPEQARKRAYVALYQTHIPRLEEAGLVDYDSDSGLISLSANSVDLDAYIDTDRDSDEVDGPSWYLYYIALVAANGVFLAAVVTGRLPVGPVVANVVTVVSLLILALVHFAYSRSDGRIGGLRG